MSVNIPVASIDSLYWVTGLDIDCDTCWSQFVRPLSTASYSVTVLDEFGCSDGDDLTVYVDKQRDIFIPNVFSPNNDGLNDIVYVNANNRNIVSIKQFSIFDRWGEMVYEANNFQANDPSFGWDGKFNTKAPAMVQISLAAILV